MGFVKTPDEIASRSLATFDFYDAEMLTVLYETSPEIVERLLPPPLKPAQKPLAMAYLAHFPTPDWSSFDYTPRLVRGEVTRKSKSMGIGEADLVLRSSDHDPWSEVEPIRVLGATHTVADSSMLKASVVAEAEPATFAPYSYLGGD
jgi:hypothetical protein